MAFRMKWQGRSPFKKDDESEKKSRYKQGELKKGFGEGIRQSADPNSVDKAIKEALEKNRLAEIEREKKYGIKGVDY